MFLDDVPSSVSQLLLQRIFYIAISGVYLASRGFPILVLFNCGYRSNSLTTRTRFDD